jgi:hypothetical protein
VSYLWTPAPEIGGQGTAYARYNTAGVKTVEVTLVATGCKETCDAIITQDIVPPTCDLTAPTTLPDCGSSGNVLTANSADAVSWAWSLTGTGWAIEDGQGTNSITYKAGAPSSEGHFMLIVAADNGCKDTCEVSFGCTSEEYCTFTMGGWGSGCPDPQRDRMMSTQPGCVRDHYFTQVFPSGYVLIGDPDGPDGDNFYSAKWTSAAAIEAFLPAGGTPSKLRNDLPLNPTTTPAGVLAGQILALRLNVEYSCAGIFTTLGMPGVCFRGYIIPDSCGKFGGLTVERFLAIADSAVGGKVQALTPFGASLSDVNKTATCLNEAFDACDETVNGWLAPVTGEVTGEPIEETPALPKEFSVSQSYPNPFNPMATIRYALPTDGKVTIEIFDIVGRKVVTLLDATEQAGYRSVVWYGKDTAGNSVASGVYFCRVQFADKSAIKKMILLK